MSLGLARRHFYATIIAKKGERARGCQQQNGISRQSRDDPPVSQMSTAKRLSQRAKRAVSKIRSRFTSRFLQQDPRDDDCEPLLIHAQEQPRLTTTTHTAPDTNLDQLTPVALIEIFESHSSTAMTHAVRHHSSRPIRHRLATAGTSAHIIFPAKHLYGTCSEIHCREDCIINFPLAFEPRSGLLPLQKRFEATVRATDPSLEGYTPLPSSPST
ncbi:hypothetical protein DOTSEDRAFT_33416 [Dothistroma septosporum NZE10]|uniref:Uncharacterized protein n=1 Tax=Dothistroma septosporum (strain NZE10 / CBS 128990) TaxID=675120 RepID=N1PWV3_DOTSN|nr:hypothetical protein DOTSEDRAFT_33416 [Dothistroma septosporum NZE10]